MTDKKETMTQPTLPVSKIYVPPNIRHPGWDKSLDKLVGSIKGAGLKQPPGVFAYTDGKTGPNGETHELVFGQRRLEACRRLKWTIVPVVLLSSKSSGKDLFVSKLVENFEREDLSALEEAEAFRQAISEMGFTAKELAERISKTDGYVSQRLSLLKMPDSVQKAVQKGDITPTHARELSRVTDEKEQKKLLEQAKHTPLPEFKEMVEAASSKKQTNRGRRAKPEKAEKAVRTDGKVTAGSTRDRGDLKKALSELDVHKKKAADGGDKLRAEFFKGMMRGIGWAGGMVKDLLSK